MAKKEQVLHEHHFVPEVVNGIALDNPETETSKETEKCHQVFNVYYDAELASYRLNYAVTCPDFMRNSADQVPKNFFQHAKSSYKDRTVKRILQSQYDRYYRGLMFNQSCLEGFSETVHKPALVFSYLFNEKDNYNITKSFVTYGTAIIKDQVDHNVIDRMMKRNQIDPETQMWYDVVAQQHIRGCNNSRRPNVQAVVEKSSIMSQRLGRNESIRLGVEAIFQVDREYLTDDFKGKRQTNFVTASKLQDQNVGRDHWLMHVTNSNTDVALINEGLMYYYLVNGRNLMMPGTVSAMAIAYQTNFNAGKASTLKIDRTSPSPDDWS